MKNSTLEIDRNSALKLAFRMTLGVPLIKINSLIGQQQVKLVHENNSTITIGATITKLVFVVVALFVTYVSLQHVLICCCRSSSDDKNELICSKLKRAAVKHM